MCRHLDVLVVVLLPILVSAPALVGHYDVDPIAYTAGVGVTGDWFGGLPWADPNVGFQGQALGRLAARQWLDGDVPWWNSYNGVGLPLVGEAQPAALFLPFVLLYHFRLGGLFIEVIAQIIAGVSTLLLLRRLKLKPSACLAGAILFELNGAFAWHGAPLTSTFGFIPLLLLGIETLRGRVVEGRPGGWALVSIALTFALYAGFPEVAYIGGLLAVVWVIARGLELTNRQRVRFVGLLFLGNVVALACALPQLVPFAEFLTRAYIGGHDEGFAHSALSGASVALSLMPCLFGPITSYSSMHPELADVWASIGGYLPALPIALLPIAWLSPHRRLFVGLVVWLALCWSKTFDLRPVSDLMNLVPLVKEAAFGRYAPSAWALAAAVLVAMSLDVIARNDSVKARWLSVGFCLTAVMSTVALWRARDILRVLLEQPGSARFAKFAVAWMVVTLVAGLGVLLTRRQWRIPAIVALLTVDASVAFTMPIRSGFRRSTPVGPGIAFLQERIGLHRIHSLGPIMPNYGAYFGIAQTNHNYLPVSKDWLAYIASHLDPEFDPIVFISDRARVDRNTSAEQLVRERAAAFEEVSVKYVVAGPGVDILERGMATAAIADDFREPFQLSNGKSVGVRWTFTPPPQPEQVDRVAVAIGNYQGKSDGNLTVELCVADGHCSRGTRELAGSADNAPFAIRLERPLDLASSASVNLHIAHEGGNNPVALYLTPGRLDASVVLDDEPQADLVLWAKLGFARGREANGMVQVYEGRDMNIFELAHPKHYFETVDGECELTTRSRTSLEVRCSTPATLKRREAFYPGWSARIDDTWSEVVPVDEIFQSVAIPAGTHRILFVFHPSYFRFISLGFLAGLAGLAIGIWRERRGSSSVPQA